MEKYENAGSLITPSISLDPEKGTLEIIGRSIPENPIEFYTPFINALDEYTKSPQPVTNVTLKFEYYNSSSSKCLLEIFKQLERMHKDAILQICPEADGKTFLLTEFAPGNTGGAEIDIPDPIQMSDSFYRNVLFIIRDCIGKIVEGL